MKYFARLIFISCLLAAFCTFNANAQDSEYDSLLNYYLESDSILLDQLEYELASEDLDILDLIDSLLLTDFNYSQLSLRLGYTSDITYAGRNFGIQQYGFGMGASYYHKTGLFADVSGYWNSSLEPAYNPTITTFGYFGSFTKKWTYTASYDHFFYNTNADDEFSYYPITNSLNTSTFLELGNFTLGGDYSFLFGDEKAHRIRGNLMHSFTKKDWGFIDRFVFMPSASILMGNSYIYQINPISQTMNYEIRYDIRQILFEQYGHTLIRYLWRNHRQKYLELERQVYEENKELFTEYEITTNNVFGVMNYTFSFPFYFYINNFTFALSYHYNLPVALTGEDLSIEPNSYAGATLIYNIPFMKKNKK